MAKMTPEQAPVTRPRWAAVLVTAIFALIAQGAGVVLVPSAARCPAGGPPATPHVLTPRRVLEHRDPSPDSRPGQRAQPVNLS